MAEQQPSMEGVVLADGHKVGSWLSASSILGPQGPKLPLFGSIDPSNTKQGDLSDCWLIAALALALGTIGTSERPADVELTVSPSAPIPGDLPCPWKVLHRGVHDGQVTLLEYQFRTGPDPGSCHDQNAQHHLVVHTISNN